MARIPLTRLETGPIIAPALKMANDIREGRARAAITEETARTYPEQRRLAINQSRENLAQSQLGTQEKQIGLAEKKFDWKQKQANAPEQARMQQLGNAIKLNAAIRQGMQQAETPEQYDMFREKLLQSYPNASKLMAELAPEERTPEGYKSKRDKYIETTLRLDKDIYKQALINKGRLDVEKTRQAGASARQASADQTRKQIADEEMAAREAIAEARDKGLDDRVIKDIRDEAFPAWQTENLINVGSPDYPQYNPDMRKPGYKPYDRRWVKNYLNTRVDELVKAKQRSKSIAEPTSWNNWDAEGY